MAFKNRIRVPIEIIRPQYPSERIVFRKADGSSKTISSVIRKVMEGQTDYMPEKWHEALIVALSHDEVNIESDKYLGGVVLEGDYNIEYVDFLDYPNAPAKFKVQITPFDATNSNCQTCEEATQLELTDDHIPTSLGEETTYTYNVATNDNICCHPAVFSITNFDAAYLDSASISQLGVITFHVKGDLVEINNVPLLTYRVTCPNGSYDEAVVYGNISGTIPGCLSPQIHPITSTTSTTANVFWTEPSPVPDDGYIWELFEADAPGSPVQSGTTTDDHIEITGLTPATLYIINVRGDCGTIESNNASTAILTDPQDRTCGQYEITYHVDAENNETIITASFQTCIGIRANAYMVYPSRTITICALQRSPGVPVYITTDQPTRTTIEYLGEC